MSLTTWSGSLHKSFRLLPVGGFTNAELLAFLESAEGTHKRDILARLPYDEARRHSSSAPSQPDPRRYRDAKQVFESCGLLWEDDDGRIHFTEFGASLKRFMPLANQFNVRLIARHAALGLSVCQLRNPTRAGSRYDECMLVFPNKFIWKAMLCLDQRISSDELNRGIFRVRDNGTLDDVISRIRAARKSGILNDIGTETITGGNKNDRIIPIVSIASFGWTLISQKDEGGWYSVRPDCVRLLEAAVAVPVRHADFPDARAYVKRISDAACLTKDVR